MTSLIYPAYQRVVNVYHNVDGTPELATDLCDGGNIAGICEGDITFNLSAERGCGQSEIKTLATLKDGSRPSRANPFLLALGDIVEILPEPGADPWYTGYVASRADNWNGRHSYDLQGLAGLLEHLPPTETAALLYFGRDVPTGATPGDGYYFPSHSTAGIVQWLLRPGGMFALAQTGIVYTPPLDFTCDGGAMSVAESEKLSSYILDWTSKTATALDDLARQVIDVIPAHLTAGNPWPCIWGVKANRAFYFNFRPAVEVLKLDVKAQSADRPPGIPALSFNGEVMQIPKDGFSRVEGTEFRNCLMVRGGADDTGEPQEFYYTNTDSIAKYRQRRSDLQEVAAIGSEGDAARFAASYFQRYANPETAYKLTDIPLISKTSLPFPWAGYGLIVADGLSESAGKKTLGSVSVTMGKTPKCSVTVGEMERGFFASGAGGTRWPGGNLKAALDSIPRVSQKRGRQSTVMADLSNEWTYWSGW